MKIIKKIYWIFKKNIIINLFWYIEFIYLKYINLEKKMNYLQLDGKILILIPHADDELIGCYKLIKENKNNCKLFLFSFTGYDNTLQNRMQREDEFIKFCNYMNLSYIISKDIDKEKELKNIISEFNPDYIFLPSIFDWHWEHRKINDMLFRTNLYIKNVIWYKVTVPFPSLLDIYYLGLTKKDLNEKYKLFNRFYKSQKGMPIRRLKFSDRIDGKFIFSYAAESYVYLSLKDWKKYLNNYRYNQLDNFLNYINNLVDIRKKIDIWYKNNIT